MSLFFAAVVLAFALFLLGLAVTIYARPSLAERFLDGFASSARAHYLEVAGRLAVGTSLIVFSPEMWRSGPFRLFGWLIVVTTIGLACLPWRWHRHFARRVMPPVFRHMKLFGLAAAALGCLLLYAALGG